MLFKSRYTVGTKLFWNLRFSRKFRLNPNYLTRLYYTLSLLRNIYIHVPRNYPHYLPFTIQPLHTQAAKTHHLPRRGCSKGLEPCPIIRLDALESPINSTLIKNSRARLRSIIPRSTIFLSFLSSSEPGSFPSPVLKPNFLASSIFFNFNIPPVKLPLLRDESKDKSTNIQ